jgi:hypothetical protein
MNSNEWLLSIVNSSHKKDHPMLQKLTEWLRRLWRDDAPAAVERLWLDEYAPYVREKYGIPQAFINEEEEDKHWNT